MSDNELGAFLRARRAEVTPAEVGLPPGSRRRTPGLRRAEVAMLAGVSVEYLIRLEQGRDRRPSPQVLAALAGPLRLTAAERARLYRLTKSASGFTCGAGERAPSRTVRPGLRAVLDQLEPAAAALLNQVGDVLAHTAGFARLAAPIGLLDGAEPNLTRYVFTDPRARTAYPDWAQVADERVAALKNGPPRPDFTDEMLLLAGAEFAERAERVPGVPRPHGVLRLEHPAAGPLRLAYEILELPGDEGLRLLIQLPADEATAEALRALAPLRLVAG
ncbi:DNA-binding protein [Actinoplanes sp. SE50]|uniref:helix-turn-helix domain-containing protein n=1 Tax=unclassified Actinoplanes TaxID=2626549 RepID=UPI00023EC576|nr:MULTISPECIES: helix-turn-helix transcriptional regulator [unclassified Actinoplanes]AEV81929.1 transcriptional regulator, XRE family [Actinoplanes sp. SE50/110]ATO80329.1 DNA-binding protein [Actinoplanes sp. SE50]SLL97735.1 transcriptional regulator [Actinoplanes sp. SE50/110]